MRISKKFVYKHTGYKSLFRNNYDSDYYVNVKNVFEATMYFFGALGIIIGAAFIVFWFYTYVTPSKIETNFYNNRCDVLASSAKHYTIRNPDSNKHNMQCVIGPDWHRVDI